MLLRELSCLRDESFDYLFLFFFSLLMRTSSVKIAQLLSHLSEESILKGFEFAQAEHLATLLARFSTFCRTLDEVQNISFLFLSNFTLSDILENTAK